MTETSDDVGTDLGETPLTIGASKENIWLATLDCELILTKTEIEMDDPGDDLPDILESERNTAERNKDFPSANLGVTLHIPKFNPNTTSFVPIVGAFIGSSELDNGKSKLNILVTLLEINASFAATNKLRPEPGLIFAIMIESEIQYDAKQMVSDMLNVVVAPKSENWDPNIAILENAVAGV